MRKKTNNLDERQEMTLLQIEHRGCWLAFWMLVVSLGVQLLLDANSAYMAGEWTVLMVLSVYIAGACIKNGIWDRKWKPTPKTNLMLSVVTGLVLGTLYFIVSYRHFHKIYGSIATGVMMFLSGMIFSFAILSLSAWMYKKRIQKMEEIMDDDKESL